MTQVRTFSARGPSRRKTAFDGASMTKMDAVAEWIRDAVLRGSLQAGSPLSAQDIARHLKVSPTPVREAFGVLQAQGFLERRAHQGVTVLDVYQDLESVRDLCVALEVMSTRRAAERRDPYAIAEMGRLIDEARLAAAAANLSRLREVNLRFHVSLARASGSRTLIEATKTHITRAFFKIPMEKRRMSESIEAHVALLEAVKRGHVQRAVAITKRHNSRFQQTSLGARPNNEARVRGAQVGRPAILSVGRSASRSAKRGG